MPAHQLELALWLEADRMGSLLAALDEESLENQRDVVKNERRQRYDNVPYGTAFERMIALAYPEGHPYHHTPIGSMADLDAVTLDDARAFFRANYAPNNAVLAVVGDIDSGQDASMGREILRLHPVLRRQGAAPRRHAPRHHRRRTPGGDPGGGPGARADGRLPDAARRHA
jgi:Predicted Zn-dependent peptidases